MSAIVKLEIEGVLKNNASFFLEPWDPDEESKKYCLEIVCPDLEKHLSFSEFDYECKHYPRLSKLDVSVWSCLFQMAKHISRPNPLKPEFICFTIEELVLEPDWMILRGLGGYKIPK